MLALASGASAAELQAAVSVSRLWMLAVRCVRSPTCTCQCCSMSLPDDTQSFPLLQPAAGWCMMFKQHLLPITMYIEASKMQGHCIHKKPCSGTDTAADCRVCQQTVDLAVRCVRSPTCTMPVLQYESA